MGDLYLEINDLTDILARQENSTNAYAIDRARERATNYFSKSSVAPLMVKCIYDLVILSNPQCCTRDELVERELQLENYARTQFIAFINAFYEHVCNHIDDYFNILKDNPWVVSDCVVMANIISAEPLLNYAQNEIRKKILYVLELNDHIINPFRRAAGPGLSIIIWAATSNCGSREGEFLRELPVGCRGQVQLSQTTHRAEVMGVEIVYSSSDIPQANLQLIRRFQTIVTCLEVTHQIKAQDCTFEGRVFYCHDDDSYDLEQRQDYPNSGLSDLSFLYHQVG